MPTRARSSVWDVGDMLAGGDGLGKWWEARGGASARFPWRERLGLGECVS